MRPNRVSRCALENGRCCSTGRRVLLLKDQLIPNDDKGALVVLALPIWKCRAVNLKREALFRLVDDVGAEMSQASRYNRFVFIYRAAGTVTRHELGEVSCNENYRISPVRIEHQQAFCIWAIAVERSAVPLSYDRNERPGAYHRIVTTRMVGFVRDHEGYPPLPRIPRGKK